MRDKRKPFCVHRSGACDVSCDGSSLEEEGLLLYMQKKNYMKGILHGGEKILILCSSGKERHLTSLCSSVKNAVTAPFSAFFAQTVPQSLRKRNIEIKNIHEILLCFDLRKRKMQMKTGSLHLAFPFVQPILKLSR